MTPQEKLDEIERFLLQSHKRNSRSASEVLHFIATGEWPPMTVLPLRLRKLP